MNCAKIEDCRVLRLPLLKNRPHYQVGNVRVIGVDPRVADHRARFVTAS